MSGKKKTNKILEKIFRKITQNSRVEEHIFKERSFAEHLTVTASVYL